MQVLGWTTICICYVAGLVVRKWKQCPSHVDVVGSCSLGYHDLVAMLRISGVSCTLADLSSNTWLAQSAGINISYLYIHFVAGYEHFVAVCNEKLRTNISY